MKRIKKMQAQQLYFIEGASAANSPFFEKEADCKEFLRLADKYLNEFLSINSFQNTRDGWAMIITTKSAEAIKQAYHLRRSKSKKCKTGCEHHEVWRILSDQIRIWLSTYVKSTNGKSGRTGGKVRGNFKRFVFDSIEEVKEMKEKLLSLKYDQSQPVKKYRPSKKLFRVRKKQIKHSVFMCCAGLTTDLKIKELGLRCLNLPGLMIDVLRHLVRSTFEHHFPLDSPLERSI